MEFDEVFGNDYEVEGQLSIFDLYEKPSSSSMVAVSKVFAAARKQMSLAEWKTFILALTHIKWTVKNANEVILDRKKLLELLGLTDSDTTDNLRRDLSKMPAHSLLMIDKKDKSEWESGNVIERIRCCKGENIVRVVFTKYYMPLFEELDKERNYVTLWADDLFRMTSERSILFYEDLRLHSDTRKDNLRTYGVKDLKRMFGIPKDGKGSYMRRDGHFDRPAFERKVIDPLCEDLQNCAMLQLSILEDGKYYKKVKYNGRVIGYEFAWSISNRPGIATAEEVQELQERVDANPQVLKIAKDILAGGEKKQKPKKQKKESSGASIYEEYAESALRKRGYKK